MKKNLGIVVLLALVACGGGEQPPQVPEPEPEVSGQAEPKDAPEPEAPSPPPAEPAVTEAGFLLEGVGFETPESVLYDPAADLYLVSNINGSPADKDGNGFISQVSPDGEVVTLKWIDGAAEGTTLHSPKGSALTAEGLFVADIDVVRIFDRETGASLGEVVVPGARFLNDVAAAGDGTVYVTDSSAGLLIRITLDRSAEQVAEIERANGIAVRDGRVLGTSGSDVFELGDDGRPITVATLPTGILDGIVLLDDGSILVSSWEGSAVYRVDQEGEITRPIDGITAPADIGFDPTRGLVLIPHFQDNRLEARPLP